MDYPAILKRAWELTRRYPVLWLFGLFAGGWGGGGWGGGGWGGGGWGGGGWGGRWGAGGRAVGEPPEVLRQGVRFAERNLALIVAIAAVLLVVGLVLFTVNVAARGGVVHLVNEAEEGRPVRGLDGWRVGFARWWRVFAIGLLVALAAAMIVPPVIVGVLTCVLLPFVILLALAWGFAVGVVAVLAVRYAVLRDLGVFGALQAGIGDLCHRFTPCLAMSLILWVIGLAFALGSLAVTGILLVPTIVFAIGEMWLLAAVAALPGTAAALFLTAVFNSFTQASWTLFFRQLNQLPPTTAVPAYGGDLSAPPPAYGAPPERE